MLVNFSSVDGYCKNYARPTRRSCNAMTILQRQLRASDGKCIYTVAHNTHIREEVQSCSEVCMLEGWAACRVHCFMDEH
jgi:hypothetical protein